MNNKEEIENENIELGISIPLLTQDEMNGIDINIDSVIDKFLKMYVKRKDLVIAQHIIDK